jgi:hypothetical protein
MTDKELIKTTEEIVTNNPKIHYLGEGIRCEFGNKQWYPLEEHEKEIKELICSKCGFPKSMERDIVIMDCNALSFASYMIYQCEECGHQKSGWTIKKVKEHYNPIIQDKLKTIQKLEQENKLIQNRLNQMIDSHRCIEANLEAYKKENKKLKEPCYQDETNCFLANENKELKEQIEQYKKRWNNE